jgi:hypothetical protein
MGKAKREGGLYYTPQGVAVDAEGRKVEDAPKLRARHRPEQAAWRSRAPAPGAMTMRLDEDSIRALGGKPAKEPKESKSASRGADEEQQRDNVNAPPDPGNRTPTETAPDGDFSAAGRGWHRAPCGKGGGRKGGARKGGARKGGARKSAGNK